MPRGETRGGGGTGGTWGGGEGIGGSELEPGGARGKHCPTQGRFCSTELPTHVGCGLIVCLRRTAVPLCLVRLLGCLGGSPCTCPKHSRIPETELAGPREGDASGCRSPGPRPPVPACSTSVISCCWACSGICLAQLQAPASTELPFDRAPDRPGASVAPPLLSEAPEVLDSSVLTLQKDMALESLVLLASLLCFNIPLPDMHCIRPPEDLVEADGWNNRAFNAEQTMLFETGWPACRLYAQWKSNCTRTQSARINPLIMAGLSVSASQSGPR